jgi:hypothetical protein
LDNPLARQASRQEGNAGDEEQQSRGAITTRPNDVHRTQKGPNGTDKDQ